MSKALTKRSEDYSQWYLDVIEASELIDASPVRGCMVIRPNGYAIWENIKDDLDKRFKDTGHVNAYFPLLIPQSFLSKEAEHVEGFAKECALVTHHRLRTVIGDDGKPKVEPDPDAKLEEPLVIRPTSETIIWHMYGKWINSHRDLPVLINQWANVMRWEMRTRPFLRTAEFLWQEGHTAHATEEEAREEATKMLKVYRDFCHETLAVPVITGEKTANERFAGAEDTYTIEAMMQNGWALQSGTSHFLGQNFAKAFNVTYRDANNEQVFVWATSWGVSTRLIGALIMTHSDDQGLVLPPKVAPLQIIITPIWKGDDQKNTVLDFADKVAKSLRGHFRCKVDDRDNIKPGAKYYEWEKKGVPLRLEIGERDVQNNSVFCAKRTAQLTNEKKFALTVDDNFVNSVQSILDNIQSTLLQHATQLRESKTNIVYSYQEMLDKIADGGFFFAPWKDDSENETKIKDDCKATIRCYPDTNNALDLPTLDGKACFYSGEPATHWALFARAY